MAETLGTKDVLEQMDARLDNVEQDLRALRQEIADLRAKVSNCSAVRLPLDMNSPFTTTDRYFERARFLAILTLLNVVGLLLFK